MSAAESLFILPNVVCLIWLIYNNKNIYENRNKDFIQKRGISLVLGFNFAIAMEMVVRIFSMLQLLYLVDENSFLIHNILPMLTSIASLIVAFCCIFFLNVKAWMIYYQYYWTYYTLQLKWQQLINPNIVNEENKNNWYIKNRAKYGQLSSIYKLFAFPHIFIAIINASIISFYELVHVETLPYIIMTCSMIIFTLFLVIFYACIVKKTPSFDDIYYIHRENVLLAKILIIGFVILFITSGVTAYIVEVVYDWDPFLMRISGAWAQYPLVFMWFAISYSSTAMILKKNQMHLDVHNEFEAMGDGHKSELKLNQILSNDQYINTFIKYLSREFSMENLLAFIEFTQFQIYCKQKMTNMTIDGQEFDLLESYQIMKDVKFPENIPLSYIIETTQSEDESEDLKVKARKIYEKYVAVGSELEINVSWQSREKVINILDNLEMLINNNGISVSDLYVVFDECKVEIWTLMLGSFFRFKSQPEFTELSEVAQEQISDMELITKIVVNHV